MKFLFDGKYAPLTDGMAFIEAHIEDVVKAFYRWIENITMPDKKTSKQKHEGTFEALLIKSLPFKYPWKDIFFETKSRWTGFYQNIGRTEISHASVVGRYANAQVIGAEAWISDHGRKVNGWGGAFYLFKGNDLIRHMMLSDQDRWEFDNFGEPFPFEDVEKYKEKFIRNRFTPEMLDKYLKEFGIDFFNEDFYMPPGSTAYIIEQIRPPYNENDKPMSLEEMRKRKMYE